MQKDTLASGEKKRWPRMNLLGSFLQPNMAANTHKYTPMRKTTLL